MKRISFILCLLWATMTVAAEPQAQVQRFGWAGEQAAKAARQRLAQELPPLVIEPQDKHDVRGKTIALWHFTKILNGGKHLPNVRQQIGDCVSFGFGHACEYSMATHICVGADRSLKRVYKPYLYGSGRVFIAGGRLRGDGSTGAWQAAAIQRYGVLAFDEEGVPDYSGRVARQWGAPPGPPKKFVAVAKQYLGEARLIRDWDTCLQAISNGWPVAICSSAGFGRIVEANGRIEGRWTTSWPHCMCLIAFDNRPGREACYCLNSWGPNAHARASRYAELDGAPPGGFWILQRDVVRILRQGDSYAVSFNGFKRQDLFGWLKREAKGAHVRDDAGSDDVGESGKRTEGEHVRRAKPNEQSRVDVWRRRYRTSREQARWLLAA